MLIMNGSTILMDIFLGYNMAVIIFDLFGTLIDIDDNQNDYDKALKWLADTYFENRFIELKKSSKIFKAKYSIRIITYCKYELSKSSWERIEWSSTTKRETSSSNT